jgi:hypothetical protein
MLYHKGKLPILGFSLALLFGPFGFLYYSWRKALIWGILIFVIMITLRLYFPLHYRWLKFIFPPLLAVYAYLDLKKPQSVSNTAWHSNK